MQLVPSYNIQVRLAFKFSSFVHSTPQVLNSYCKHWELVTNSLIVTLIETGPVLTWAFCSTLLGLNNVWAKRTRTEEAGAEGEQEQNRCDQPKWRLTTDYFASKSSR
jgi:hypothetical protein